MSNGTIEAFAQSYFERKETESSLSFGGSGNARLKLQLGRNKIELTAVSRRPVVFFQLLRLSAWQRADGGAWTRSVIRLGDSPMSVPDISRQMPDFGWDTEGRTYLPFYLHSSSGKGMPRPIAKGSSLHQAGFEWSTDVSDAPGPGSTSGLEDAFPEHDFVTLDFRTFVTQVEGAGDVETLATADASQAAGLTLTPAHVIEWTAIPGWGRKGNALWRQIFDKLPNLPMGGLVYLVAAFDPEAPFAGLHEIAPRALPAAERDAAFFQPLDFWQSRFRD